LFSWFVILFLLLICVLIHWQALGADSYIMREFTFPVIRIATDLKGQEHVYLLEDGIDLWLALMEHATSCPE